MSILLSILAFFVVAFVVGVTIIYFVVKRKLGKGLAWGEVKLLEAALKELQEKQAQATQPDQDLTDLVARVESAHSQAKAALDSGDFKAVTEIALPVLTELGERLKKATEEKAQAAEAARAAEAAQALLPEHVEAEPVAKEGAPAVDVQPQLSLPAPEQSGDGGEAKK
jgi:hypothetical protein